MEELGLVPAGDDTLGGEKSVEPEPEPPLEPASPSPPSSHFALGKQEREHAREELAEGLPQFHYGRLDRTNTGQYVVTITDITGTLTIQMCWSPVFLNAFMALAAKQIAVGE